MFEHLEARAHQESRTQHWLQRPSVRAGSNRCMWDGVFSLPASAVTMLVPVPAVFATSSARSCIGRPTAAGGRADRTLDQSVDVLTSADVKAHRTVKVRGPYPLFSWGTLGA